MKRVTIKKREKVGKNLCCVDPLENGKETILITAVPVGTGFMINKNDHKVTQKTFIQTEETVK